ncbi:uncharacterized protein LOC121809231 [Salvia splendens]|uniref:uncharacterized protein LOC121809231 n=1 Tax=Salvia splendens TaxID=180675 RepID=UPI001C2572F8|nr:uncharacterized protein LOC121809231 [Salvia splendens]
MNPIEDRQLHQPGLTGGNTQELFLGAPRRPPIGNRRDGGDHPRPPPREDPSQIGLQRTDSGSVDPITQGFDRIMARFDQLEVRVDGLEFPRGREFDPPDDDRDSDDREYAEYRGSGDLAQRDQNPHNRFLGFRERRGARGGRRGAFSRRDDARRGGDWQYEGVHDNRMGTYQPRRPSNWDPPATRQQGWRDQRRRASCWDPPVPRDRSPYQLGSDLHHGVKMRAPHFDGTDVSSWISRVEYYFDHIMMPEEDRLHYAVMLFDPPAAEWIFNYRNNNRYVTWPEFLEDVRHRFDPQSFRNYIGPLAKLVQTGTVAEYHDTFEKFLNRVEGVPDYILIPVFIEGLKMPIQEKVELQQPQSLAEAMALALRLAANQDHRYQQASSQRRQWPSREARQQPPPPSAPDSSAAQGSKAGKQPQELDRPRFTPIRVSNAEKSERSRKGLFWHCPEKYTPGHVCATRLLCYVGDDEWEESGQEQDSPPLDEELITEDISHLHSLTGGKRSVPFQVMGDIGITRVRILIDTGSTHNFLHSRFAEQLQLQLSRIRPFRVYVGNGASLICSHISRRTKLSIQGTDFLTDLHILDVHGWDVILGMDWLESLGRISADFVGKTLEFQRDNKSVILQGRVPGPQQISLQSLALLASFSAEHEFYEIVAVDPDDGASPTAAADPDFPPDIPADCRRVLDSHRGVFDLPIGMPPPRAFDHRIHLLPGTRPINVRPYRYPYFQKNEIERQVTEMLSQGIIQRSQSPFSSPVLLIRKKDGTFRFCIDYRALNLATVPDQFPIPTADELFDELGCAKFFTKLDLRSGYHQIRMHDADIFKTAFRTHDGHFEFLVMPFGLTNAPSTFQAAMNTIFQPLLRRCVIVFFDDILVYSPTLADHCEHLSQVLSLLSANKFYVKLSKCSFCCPTVEYLGHLIADGTLIADPRKIEAMTAWPLPRNVKQLRGFLGLTGYYRRFVAHYASIASPLTELLKKDAFVWTQAASEAFQALKAAMTSTPVLRLPNFSKTFYVETDASDTGIGAVLIQEGHPIAYFSRKLGPRRRVASTYHKELYAIVEAVQKWRQYLLGREFVIRSDQKSLKELLQQIVQTPDQQLYVRKLMGYNFRIEYKKGALNRAADALSRREDPDRPFQDQAESDELSQVEGDPSADAACLTAVAHPVPKLLDTLRQETATKSDLVDLTADIQSGKAPAQFTFADGLIYFNRRIVVSQSSKLKRLLMEEHHCTPIAGHPGHERTFRLLSAGFYWTKLRKEVRDFVNACAVCQSTKYSTQKPAGLLQPLPVPSQVWDDVSMDFITGLPQSRGYTTIMVVVDRLSKYAHFAALPTRFDALRVAHLFVNTVVRHHGFPKTLVSDRDSVFLNAVWEEILRLSGTKLNFTTAYHPQSDGQTEIRNKGLEQYLRAFTSDRPSTWSNFLPWAELALNCFHHAGLGTSPFKALYGREPPLLVAAAPSAKTPPNVADLINQRGELLIELRKNLSRAQQRMTAAANKHRRHVEYEVGDFVWLKLQPYRQHSVAKPISAKLAKRFYGPFEVVKRIGPVAYKLRLPEGSRIHDVFHVSLLRAFVKDDPIVPLPDDFVGNRPVAHPVEILDSRILWHRGAAVDHVLVRWSDGSDSPSWEPLEEMKKRYPTISLEDKEVSKEGGVVTSSTELQETEGAANDNMAEILPSPCSSTPKSMEIPSTSLEPQNPSEEVSKEAPERKLRPRQGIKQPERYKDFVSK